MTATATVDDQNKISTLCDMETPTVIRYNPITENHIFYKILRPPSNFGFRGEDENQPSTLQLINMLVLNQFISSVQNGTEAKTAMTFVQSYKEGITQNIFYLFSGLKIGQNI